ncbi:MAG: 30S ribosomal protein S6 [Desulfosarcinaceae bacterium]|nr:30S ribosomal protein S6 [Desulfosarcinaceae bacterium]
MRRYETIIITDPDLAEDARKALTAKIGELMAAEGGFLVRQDDWGIRKLAYEIRKKPRGYYTLFDFCGQGTLVDEMERQFRIDDRVLKYMTVVLDKEADIEAIKAEMAAAAADTDTATEEAAADAPTEAAAEAPAAESTKATEEEVTETSAETAATASVEKE